MKYRFSGHQTFPLRYPWLTKGIRGLAEDEQLFFRDDAIVTLGVGKNMVSAIRFWCEATKFATVDGRKKLGRATHLGAALLGENGWDPYLEHPASLWLIHWQLASDPADASTWYLAFTKWSNDVFSRSELVDWLEVIAERNDNRRVSRNSLKRDVDVFLRTYVPSKIDRRRPVEDTFDSPLVELGLIHEIDSGTYEMPRGHRPTLPLEIFALAMTDFWHRAAQTTETVSFENVLYGPGSPGGVFRLSAPALVEMLERLPPWVGIQYDETAGLRSLSRSGPLPKRSDCLAHYFEMPHAEKALA